MDNHRVVMAAGSLSNAFESRFEHKRKRPSDDHLTTNDEFYSTKRRNLSQLPIRSPARPSIAVTPALGQFGIPPGTLTPDSIPEDDEYNGQSNTYQQIHRPRTRPHSTSNTSNVNPLRVNVDSHGETSTDVDMNASPPQRSSFLSPLRIGRARSNDLMSPVWSPAALITPSPTSRSFAHDRIPTPVASSFPARGPFDSSFASATARQMRSHLMQTSLSPMVDAESWTPQIQRPPSPDPELNTPFDDDAMMVGMEDTNSHVMSTSFSSLSVHSQDTLVDITNINSSPNRYQNWSSQTSPSPRAHGLGLDGTDGAMRPDDLRMSTISDAQREMEASQNRGHGSGRTARLHMGFRADCDKCVARVPGHYSHILWT